MKPEQEIALIQKFLNGILDAQETKLFQDRFAQDAPFAKMTKEYADTKIILKVAQKMRFQQDPASKNNKIKTILFSKAAFKIAASLLLLIVPLSIYFIAGGKSADELSKAQFSDMRLQTGTNRNHVPTGNDPFLEAEAAYAKGNTQKAIRIIKKKQALSTPENALCYFLLGDLHFKTDMPDSAIYYYQQGSRYDQHDDYGQWNIAMAYLASFKIKQATALLEEIAQDPTHSFGEKARKLLEEMNSIWFSLNIKNRVHGN